MKRTPLRRVSKKTAKVDRAIKREREEYREEFHICQVCNRALATDVHEVARGSHRAKAKLERCCWLAVCAPCHSEKLSDYSQFPITRQLAVKLVADPKFFDLKRFNEIRGRSPEAITLEDLQKWLRWI